MSEFVIGNIFVRRMHFRKKGESVQGHTHNFDHCTLILKGGVKIKYSKADGSLNGVREFWAPADGTEESWVLIKKDVHHEITALADNTHCWCVFAHRDFQGGEVVQAYNGNCAAYT